MIFQSQRVLFGALALVTSIRIISVVGVVVVDGEATAGIDKKLLVEIIEPAQQLLRLGSRYLATVLGGRSFGGLGDLDCPR